MPSSEELDLLKFVVRVFAAKRWCRGAIEYGYFIEVSETGRFIRPSLLVNSVSGWFYCG